MKLIHVVPAITEEASGPSYTVPRLCEALLMQDNEVTLAALDWAPLKQSRTYVRVFPLGLGPRRLGSSPSMRVWLNQAVQSGTVDLIHNHGMWQMSALYPSWAARKSNVQLVYSPRGAFSDWAMAQGSRFKPAFWNLVQRPALERAACFHATSIAEYKNIRGLGFKQPVAVIANGIDVPATIVRERRKERTLLFLGRIHAVKGIDILLKAWERVHRNFPEWHLAIAGGDVGYSGIGGYASELAHIVSKQKLARVNFLGPLYGDQKHRAYANANLYVLPSRSENFAVTVAEALAAGTPAIVSKGAPWSGLEANGAGWWIDISVDSLAECLAKALAYAPEHLEEMGMRGRDWMKRDYSWSQVGSRMSATYEWIRHRSGPPPEWIFVK